MSSNFFKNPWLDGLLKSSVLALMYFVAGRSGLLMAAPPGNATLFWPASGLAISFCYVYGYSLLPGVFFGAWLMYVAPLLVGAQSGAVMDWLGLPVFQSLGATAQSAFAVFLLYRYVGKDTHLKSFFEIVRFSVLSGPIACLVSCSSASFALYQLGIVEGEDLLFTWASWYTGDALGVLVFAPCLILILNRGYKNLRRKIFVSVPLVIIFTGIISMFFMLKNWTAAKDTREFMTESAQAQVSLEGSFERHIFELNALKSFYDSSAHVDEHEFETFVADAFRRHPEVRALVWAPRVDVMDVERFERERRASGNSEFKIYERDASGQPVRLQHRAEYFPVLYLQSAVVPDSAKGFDMNSEPARREALAAARDSGQPRATQAMVLAAGTEREAVGFLVFYPVYQKKMAVDTVLQRRAALQGVLVGVYEFDSFLTPAMKAWDARGVGLRVHEHDDSGAERILFSSGASHELSGSAQHFTHEAAVNFAGRLWHLEFKRSAEYLLGRINWSIWYALGGSLIFAFFVTAFLLAVTGQTEAIEEVVRDKTRELSEKNILLERSNKELEDFAYVASHDLKAPLRHISMSAGFIRQKYDELLDKRGHELLEIMVSSTGRMQQMIESLLSYSRVGRTQKNFHAVNLGLVLDDTLKALDVQIRESLAEILILSPLPKVTGDDDLLGLLFQNLIQNAIKYSKRDVRPEIRIGCEREGAQWTIWVEDNGIGIPPEYGQKIFQIFQRLHLEHEYEGVGIGLAICQRIVEFHGGTIELDKNYKDGARFVFTLNAVS